MRELQRDGPARRKPREASVLQIRAWEKGLSEADRKFRGDFWLNLNS